MSAPPGVCVYEIRLRRRSYRLAPAGPGLGPETLLAEAVRRFYVDIGATQARFVQVVHVTKGSRQGDVHWYRVRTSRHEWISVSARPAS